MSVGPRSVITSLIDIDFPRPRDLTNPVVAALFKDIEQLVAPDLQRLDGMETLPRPTAIEPKTNDERERQ
jgi:hypothetical protein